MGMTISRNVDHLEVSLMQLGERAIKNMSDRMRLRAIKIRDLARSYSPIDTGLLESSIDYKVIKHGRRNAFVVFINLDAVHEDGKKQLGDYAFIMEEELHPYGRQKGRLRFTLGKGSRAKRMTGKKVGGHFLSRAVKDGTKDLMEDMAAAVRRATGGQSLAGTQYRREKDMGDE